MKRLAMLYGGSLPERRVADDPRFGPWLARMVYLPDLPSADLQDLDGLIVPEGTNHRQLRASSGVVTGFLARGGAVITFGDQPVSWLPGLAWEFRPALPSPVLAARFPDSGFHAAVPLVDQIWHHHGVLTPPAGAAPLLVTEDGATVLYVDRASTAGTILASTLDPIRHCGETAMPAAGRFLELVLPWVVTTLLERPGVTAASSPRVG